MTRILAALSVLALAASAQAMRAPARPLPQRIAVADAVFVGKVEGDERDKDGGRRAARILKLKVSKSFLGDAGKEVEVIIGAAGTMASTGPAMAKGDEVLILARKHPKKKGAYQADAYEGLIPAKGLEYKTALDEAKKTADLLAEPVKSLKGKERTMAAILLVLRYKTPTGGKEEAVPAAESKLILEALAEGEWGGRGGISPVTVFYRLGATEKDGWTPPKGGDFREAAKTWLKDNAGKFKLTRFARPESGPSAEPK